MTIGSRAPVLIVDDDPRLLEAVGRLLHRKFEVTTAQDGNQALALAAERQFAVVVSDYTMPGMNGVALLRAVRAMQPDAVRILLTGQADLSAAIGAVNEGSIFRFLEKPCASDVLLASLDAARTQHDLVVGERVLLERTLHGSIAALVDVLAISQPAAFGRAGRVKRLAHEIAQTLEVQDWWAIDVAAMLSQIGTISLAPSLVDRLASGAGLTASESEAVAEVPQVAARIIANIPRLEGVRGILVAIGRSVDQDPERAEPLPFGARLLTLAFDFDDCLTAGVTPSEAISRLASHAGRYDPTLLANLRILHDPDQQTVQVREIELTAVKPGMIFISDVRTADGKLLIARGQEATEGLVTRIENYWADLPIAGSIYVTASAHA